MTSVYDVARYDVDVYVDPMSKSPEKSWGPSTSSTPQTFANQPVKPNSEFFAKEKGNQNTYPDSLTKQRSNENFDYTDFICKPLIPSIKPRLDNLHSTYLGEDVKRNIDKIPAPNPVRQVGWEGKLR